MKLSELSPAEGSVRAPYRKGRGAGSGNGKTGGYQEAAFQVYPSRSIGNSKTEV